MFRTLFKRNPAQKTVKGATGRFDYLEIRAPQLAEENALLLIGLHGHGSNEAQMKTLVDLEPAVPFVYVALRGFLPLDDGYTWLPIMIDGGGIRIEQLALEETLGRIAEFIRAIQAQYGIPAERTVMVGYSLGGGMSMGLLTAYPQLLGGAVVMAGQLLDGVRLLVQGEQLQGKRLFLGHGVLDRLIGPEEMTAARQFLEAYGVDIVYREYRIPHVVSAAERRDVVGWIERFANDLLVDKSI